MKTVSLLGFSLVFFTVHAAVAHDIITTKLTYTRDISRIFARRCVGCHGSGSSIPLTTYGQVRPWAVDIKQQVLGRKMPPWGAVKGFGNLSPDPGLSQEEVMIIAAWVIGGAPEGSASLLPKSPPPQIQSSEIPTKLALVVSTRATLNRAITLAAIRPTSNAFIHSARIVAAFPDGHIEPLVWLFEYDGKWQRTFRFREAILLPAGTVVEATVPVTFALDCSP